MQTVDTLEAKENPQSMVLIKSNKNKLYPNKPYLSIDFFQTDQGIAQLYTMYLFKWNFEYRYQLQMVVI